MVDRLEVIALFITRLICCDSCLDVQTSLALLMIAVCSRSERKVCSLCVVLSRRGGRSGSIVSLGDETTECHLHVIWSANMPPKRNVRTAQKGPGRRTRNTQPIAAAPNARRNTPGQKPAGRRTDNSTGKRGRKAAKRPQLTKSNGQRRLRGTPGKKDTTALHDPNCYKAENGDVYRPGGN